MRTDYLNPNIYNKLYMFMTFPNVCALRLSLETGLRIDDVLSLRCDQISGRTITGTAEKTGKKYKKVISAELAARLRSCAANGWIFPHRTDPAKHRSRQAVWANMKKAAAAVGLKMNAAPHSARKTYGVEVFHDRGFDAAQRELQHDRMSTTMLYVFSDILGNQNSNTQNIDVLAVAEIIADKIIEKLQKKHLIFVNNRDKMQKE